MDKWREVELRETDVALGFVVEETNATADGRAVVAERRIRETEAWSEQVLCIVEAARRTCRHRQDPRTIPVGHADKLVSRYTVARADQAIETIAAFRRINRAAARVKRDSLGGIELAGVKAHDIVRLCVGWSSVLISQAKLEAEAPSSFPRVVDIGFDVREPEVSDGIIRRLRVRSKVSQQGVSQCSSR